SAERKVVRARARREEFQQRGRMLVHERDASYAVGCALYWAEGAKHRNTVKLTNSDPEVLTSFVSFLRRHFQVADDRMRVTCNLFADHEERRREIEDYWLDRLDLPRTSLRRSIVNRYSK